jgi:UDP-N-acetylmuramoylalanine--D-glutamate ligase
MDGPRRVLVYGLGVSGTAVARRLVAEGVTVMAADDDLGTRPRTHAEHLGIDLVVAPGPTVIADLARRVDAVVVSPGIPAGHPVFSVATSTEVLGEVELAYRRAHVPVVAVTGTNGKTTVTTLATSMLVTSGVRALAAGNIGLPLLDAVSGDAELVVAEVSSFQLALTIRFRPRVGAWVNFSPDHLDWHPTLAQYRAAKARLWANVGPGDVAVANCDDEVVWAATSEPRTRGARVVSFGTARGDYRVEDGVLVAAGGIEIMPVADLRRGMPHDVVDGLCASATAMALGADVGACRRVLASFDGLPHRVQLVGEAGGVRYFDDSKATTPGAALAALEGLGSVVLIAGGRNKGLDLSVLRAGVPRLRAVVAIGEASDEVDAVFAGLCPVLRAPSMRAAVDAAAQVAQTGDDVLLSPACASFDWYRSYAERGDDFARCVREVGTCRYEGDTK